MKVIWRLVRIALDFTVLFLIAKAVVPQVFANWSEPAQLAFTIAVPALIARWLDKRRCARSLPVDVGARKGQTDVGSKKRARQSSGRATRSARASRATSKREDGEVLDVALDMAGPQSPEVADVSEVVDRTKNRWWGGTKHQGWVPAGETVEIAGRELAGLIYVGTAPLVGEDGQRAKCRA